MACGTACWGIAGRLTPRHMGVTGRVEEAPLRPFSLVAYILEFLLYPHFAFYRVRRLTAMPTNLHTVLNKVSAEM